MSARAIRRNRERELLREARRRTRAKRATIATGAALGAAGLFAPGAEAATITVTSLEDDGSGGLTLREAIDQANNTSDNDTIVFAPTVTGEITLEQGALEVYTDTSGTYDAGNLTIQGPGAAALTISGDANENDTNDYGDSRIIEEYSDYNDPGALSISGLTLADGYAGTYYYDGYYYCTDYYYNPYTYDYYCVAGYYTGGYYYGSDGGAINMYNASLALTNVVLTDNLATDDGGAVDADGEALTVTGTTVAGNIAYDGGGGLRSFAKAITITGSNISGNATTGVDPEGGYQGTFANGASLNPYDSFTMSNTTVRDNTTTTPEYSYAGAVSAYSYSGAEMSVSNSTITGNDGGGGLTLDAGGGGRGEIVRTNIIGNTSRSGAGGLTIDETDVSLSRIEDNETSGYGAGGVSARDDSTISQTTIAGNTGRVGGLRASDFNDNEALDPTQVVKLVNSTVSGNNATEEDFGPYDDGGHGGGVYTTGENGISIRNSTIANNTAENSGGGVFSYAEEEVYGTPPYEYHYTPVNRKISSTIVANNTAAGSADDLDTGGDDGDTIGFSLENSLVETPGSATLAPASVASIFGTDPQLGPLANNGGVNRTHLPAGTSPVIDKGKANGLTVDQRGAVRTEDLSPANAADGTDIGAVESTTGPPPPDEEVDVEVTVDESQKFKGKKLKLKLVVSCDEPCTATADGTVSVGGGGKGRILFKAKKYKLKADTAELGAGESTTLQLKLDGNKKKVKKATKKIKKAVKKGKKVKAKVTVDITDEAGNTDSTDSTIKVT